MSKGSKKNGHDYEPVVDAKAEAKRIADYWKEQAPKLSDDQLRELVGNDLEQLEYTPAQVNVMVPKIIELIRK